MTTYMVALDTYMYKISARLSLFSEAKIENSMEAKPITHELTNQTPITLSPHSLELQLASTTSWKTVLHAKEFGRSLRSSAPQSTMDNKKRCSKGQDTSFRLCVL